MSMSHLTQALHRAARLYPAHIATICGARRRSYAQVLDRASRLASGLRQLGVAPGDRVGVLMANSDRLLESFYAVWWAGGVINPVNTRWTAYEVAYSLDDSDTRILIVDAHHAGMLDELGLHSRSLRTVVLATDDLAAEVQSDGRWDYERLLDGRAPIADALRSGSDLAGVFYTGGTTGVAKGVMLSHDNLYFTSLQIIAVGLVYTDDICLHVAPLFHLAAIAMLLGSMATTSTQVFAARFEPVAMMEVIQRERVSATLLVPTMLQAFIDHPQLPQFQLNSLRMVGYGASPITSSLLERTLQRLPWVDFIQGYGQTEMSPMVTTLSANYHRDARYQSQRHSAGKPAPGVEVRVVDKKGCDVATGTVGEILARGPGVMQGYWNQPELTATSLRGGWMHTGDDGYMDDDSFVYIVDRTKDMIISGGENVYSVEVENAIAQHPAVITCAVIGVPSESWGEAVHAVLVCKPGSAKPSFDEIKSHCSRLIANYKCPRSIEFRADMPLTSMGKVMKNVLRAPYWHDQQRGVG
ncbi:long-chain-fatty-acid--CoA ligase [Paraburkholderia metrosideri]|uniref:Long-chain-fatty-acid--CoA ligase n=1 Tax=Paraburkholderia metrosideri TaxID=580937 RepID=A0ABW9E0U1_9BURK